jgi:hypothetical protein
MSSFMSFPMPSVCETYKDYQPPINVIKSIQGLLDHVPSQYLAGINQIVLTNASGLSRERRRQKNTATCTMISDAAAAYHQEWNGRPAWIEIFVDNTVEGCPGF